MCYAMVSGRGLAGAPAAPGVLAYLYNHGGINNQKMALAGLLLKGIKSGNPVNLPFIYNRDQRTEEEYVIRLNDVFEVDRILEVAERHGVVVLTEQPCGERNGWDYFGEFSDALVQAPNPQALDVILDVVASLKPRIVSSAGFIRMDAFVRQSLGIDIVVQLRIEADWRGHSAEIRKLAGEPEGCYLDYLHIMSKVAKTFAGIRRVYVTADENSMPWSKHEIRKACYDTFGIELLWKTDLLPAATVEDLTPLDLSLIDYEVARRAPRFVGLSRSSFSNMLGVEMLAATREPVRGHYVYDGPGDVLIERRDNGFTSCPARAAVATDA